MIGVCCKNHIKRNYILWEHFRVYYVTDDSTYNYHWALNDQQNAGWPTIGTFEGLIAVEVADVVELSHWPR